MKENRRKEQLAPVPHYSGFPMIPLANFFFFISGYVDKDFCEDYAEDGAWAMMMFAQNFTHVDKLCDVRCKYDPASRAESPCSFDFCYCPERMKRFVNTIY